MDNVIKRLIKEELDKREAMEPDTPQKNELEKDVENKPQKRKKTEGRLSNLLNKIRRNAGDGPTTPVTKKIQVKWKRFCPIYEKYKLVRIDNGGGLRVVTAPYNTDYTIEDLKAACLLLYFPVNINKFMETTEECCSEIITAGGALLDDKIGLWPYIQNNGLVISKTTFIFSTKCFTNINLNPFSFETVCSICSSSSAMTPFGNCLNCDSESNNSNYFENLDYTEAPSSSTIPNPGFAEASSSPTILPNLGLVEAPSSSTIPNPGLVETPSLSTISNPGLIQAPSSPTILPNLGLVEALSSSTIPNPDLVEAPSSSTIPNPGLVEPPSFIQIPSDDEDQYVGICKVVVHRTSILKDLMHAFRSNKVF